MAKILIQGGTVVSSTGSSLQDVLIDGETIAAVIAPGALQVTADTTVTFTAPKLCLTLEPAKASAGRVVIVDVGVML